MKKLIHLSLALLLLTACSQKIVEQTTKTTTSQAQASRTSTSSETVTEEEIKAETSQPTNNSEEKTNEAIPPSETQEKVENDSSAIAPEEEKNDTQTEIKEELPQTQPTNEELYASTLYLVGTDSTPGAATHYAFYDVDGNGTAELITAWNHGGYLRPAAIYYLQHGVPTYLARDYVAGGGGRRETFTIYTDGTVEWDEWSSGSGGGTAYLYQLAPDNSGYWIVGQQDFNQRELPNPDNVSQFGGGRGVLDMGSLIWNAF